MKTKCIAIVFLVLFLDSLASAESVSVKYVGNVDLSSYKCENTSSSFVNRACYDSTASKLLLLLGSTYYQYCGVPTSIFSGLLNASSKGSYFNSSIKGRFEC